MRTYTSEKQPAHSKTRRLSVLCLIALAICVGALWGTPHAIPGNGVEAAAKAAGVWYVNKSSTSETEDGASWETALRTIQPAVDAAHDAGGGEVWVAQGTYNELRVSWMHYDYGGIDTGSLVMQPGVDLYGGFVGSELSRAERAAGIYSTIDGSTARGGNPACHVVAGSDNATLNGFVVTGGNANLSQCSYWGMPPKCGGGMYNESCSPVVSDCVFSNNGAEHYGGGMYSSEGAPRIEGCLFENCVALSGYGAYFVDSESALVASSIFARNLPVENQRGLGAEGAGIFQEGGTLRVVGTLFEDNHGPSMASIWDSSGTEFVRCVFRGNQTCPDCDSGGTPVTSYWSFLTFMNCLFANNRVEYNSYVYAAAITSVQSIVKMANCTLWDSSPLSSEYVTLSQWSDLDAINCIVSGNTTPAFNADISSSVDVTYSDVELGWAGEGNIDTDPQFMDPDNGDLRLRWGSPCIDHGTMAGAPENDLLGTPRPQYWGVDMGAYEFTADDGDGDTMDDAWESEHGLDPSNPLDGADDPDEDGLSNAEEFLFNTDPHDDTDPPDAFYVSNSGNDETGNGSEAEPWATISRAMTAATMYATFRATTVYLDEGVFDEPVVLGAGVTLAGQGPASTTIQYFNVSDDEHVVVTAVQNSTLRDCKVKLAGFYTSSTVLLKIADVAATIENVVFDGNDNLYSLGALVSDVGSSDSVIDNCTFRRLHFGVQALDSGINITNTLFEGIRGDAIFVRLPEAKSGESHTPLLGSTAQADTTGGNEFRSVFGSFVLNMSPVVTMAENNDWGVYTQQEIAAKMLGSVDFVPFLGAGEGEGEGEGEPDSGCMGGTFESRGSFNTGDALLLLFAVTTLTLTRYRSARRDG